MNEIIIATKNIGKSKEFKDIFAKLNVEVKTLHDFPNFEDVEETGKTFEENAILKAESLAKQLNATVIADDSGLIVDALGGEPGVYSARYAGADKDDERNNDKVLASLAGVERANRTARFYCALAVAVPGEEVWTVNGVCEGIILEEGRGTNGFGYDPIFFVTEKGKSMAELSAEEKNEISHRGRALAKLAEGFQVK